MLLLLIFSRKEEKNDQEKMLRLEANQKKLSDKGRTRGELFEKTGRDENSEMAEICRDTKEGAPKSTLILVLWFLWFYSWNRRGDFYRRNYQGVRALSKRR